MIFFRPAVLLLAVGFCLSLYAAENTDAWLKENTKSVQSYLLSLRGTDLGHRLNGIRLSDGSHVLAGYTYLGSWIIPDYRARIFLFADPDGFVPVAYVWVEKGGRPWPLPACMPDKKRPDWFVWSGAVISGDSYTFSKVYPGGELVITHCIGLPVSDDRHDRSAMPMRKEHKERE